MKNDFPFARDGHCFVIAEAGVNHNGSMDFARRLVAAARDAGADAVKFQTFNTDRLVTAEAPKAAYQERATGTHESQADMLRRLELSADAHRELRDLTRAAGLVFLSTPFDESAADLLDELGVELFKIPSGEITNLPFLRHVAAKAKPVILSTGMATLAEVRSAIEALAGCDVTLLHCVSNYPTAPADANLRAMATMRDEFGLPVGFSDHTLGIEIAIAAAALGAVVIEKHVTLDRTLPGPDHAASLEPAELGAMVSAIRNVQLALGHGRKEPAASEANTAQVARKSLVAASALPAGAVLDASMIAIMRPGTGLAPSLRETLIGRRLRYSVPAGTLFTLEMFE